MDDLESLDRYDFELPRELIAQHPTQRRTDSRMMIVDRDTETIHHSHTRDLPSILSAGDTIVVNDSRVIPARLVGIRTATRGRWEGLYLRSDDQGIGEFLSKTRGKLQTGETITLRDTDGRDLQEIVVVGQSEEGHVLFRPVGTLSWLEVLDACGRIPLPPYIRDGMMTDEDRERYQTVYARHPGSVAAPTAGLHFTKELLQELRAQGMSLASVTLHVGIGTFRPIQVDRLSEHRMHAEYGEVTEPVAKKLQMTKAEGRRVVAVGTTTVRVLETASHQPQGFGPWKGETDIFIRPGFDFRMVDTMMTNFHLPKSSLLVMISAFAGRDLILRAYREAIEEGYRFYSYGDCMLIL